MLRNIFKTLDIMAAKKPENMTLEATLGELENLVTQLESGDLPLEDALKNFERGIGLVTASQQKLTQAEQKIQMITQASETAALKTFKPEED
ncbi:exodeoxyribonuclease VII small subunit [Algibacillus agarilyticus]|uniref:exodeoxyribonuclease VII small subunit n=1 Tax=Algibacillus agarilyticus TaxID=2234133 RepID=UPI003F6A4BA7